MPSICKEKKSLEFFLNKEGEVVLICDAKFIWWIYFVKLQLGRVFGFQPKITFISWLGFSVVL